MERLQTIFERISRAGARVGGVLLLVAVGLVTFEVIARKLFNFSMAGADELAGYAYALSMTWGYAYALHKRAHIRVDVVYARLPLVVRCVLDVVAFFAFTGLFALLTVRGYSVLEQTIDLNGRADTPLAVPLVYPQVPWLLGLVFFTLCLTLLSLRSFKALVTRNYDMAHEIAHGRPEDQVLGDDGVNPAEIAAAEGLESEDEKC
ncbi:MAG: TRAP transporter small permease [Rhodospirillales bacterium]|jgi:TRAP-type C4-dicarboxylate transport system permease small subunit|nr:TRAP transporter small permease [Rhodospirillales bacterium]MDP6883143.1 TRAP transporter small permease [Rhodospirillales bacterium]